MTRLTTESSRLRVLWAIQACAWKPDLPGKLGLGLGELLYLELSLLQLGLRELCWGGRGLALETRLVLRSERWSGRWEGNR